jgi:hypothetical protein
VLRAALFGLTLGAGGCLSPTPQPAVDLPKATPREAGVEDSTTEVHSSVELDASAPASDAAVVPDASEPVVLPLGPLPFHEPMPERTLPASAPALAHANLSAARCRAELKKRAIATKPSKAAPKTILVPLRLAGTLQGVRIVTAPAPSPYGIVDCRLVLALDDMAGVLATFDVVTIRVDNLYRPRARLPGSRKRSQHAHGLAADITSFTLADGRTLTVEDDWHATIGEKPCGPDAVMSDPDDESIALRNMVCEVARRGIFHHMLTPGFDAAHRTHFHFDIQRNEKRWAIH